MDAHEISIMLAENSDSVAQYLFPNGQKEGKEWRVGSLDGEKGKSLGVSIAGVKKGVWCDFSTGEKGDMLELWKLVRNITFKQAVSEASEYLGVEYTPQFSTGNKPQFTRPQVDLSEKIEITSGGYFESRGINQATLDAYQISRADNKIAFPQIVDGQVFNVKYLTPRRNPKEKNTWSQESNAEPCLFGWQVITDDDKCVVITEGEIDCLSVFQCGYKALSLPSGSKNMNWIDYDFERLNQFQTIYLCLDNDKEGKEATKEVLQRLGEHRCKIVDLEKYKDANELLQAECETGLFLAVSAAKYKSPDELKNASEFKDEVWKEFTDTEEGVSGNTLPFSKMAGFRFRESEMTVWTGYSEHGKSQMLGQIITDLIINQQERVCIFSGELKPKKLIRRMVRQIIGKEYMPYEQFQSGMDVLGGLTDKKGNKKQISDQETGGLWIFDVVGVAKIDRLLKVFEYAFKRFNCKHFVIDSLLMLSLAEDDYNGQKAVADKLRDFKAKFNIHVHLVAHPNKQGADDSKPPTKYSVRGSVSITDLADNVLVVWRNKPKYAKDFIEHSQPDAMLICEKQRESEQSPKVNLYYMAKGCQYSETENESFNMLTGEKWVADYGRANDAL